MIERDRMIELTILMPCLNEAETIGQCIQKAKEFLESRGVSGEVLIADNGSSDGSREIAKGHGARVVDVSAKGYGAALIGGIRGARGHFVVMGDADGSYDFSSLDLFLEKLRAGYELVMGNRFLGGIRPDAMPSLHKYLGNPVLSSLGRFLFNSPLGDFHCGLRGFQRDSILSLALNSRGMEFASEMIVKATLRKLRVTEVPTILSPDGRSRPPHLQTWRDGWRHLRFLLQFSPVWLFFYPGLALFVIGLGMTAWLLPAPRSLFGVTLDVNTLVFAAGAMACGFQAMSFYMFAKTYAVRSGLLPDDPLVARLRQILRLETGLVLGALIFLLGLVLAAYAVGMWGERKFGLLNPIESLRIVVPSASLMVLGLQFLFSSCLLSILHLETPNRREQYRRTDRIIPPPNG